MISKIVILALFGAVIAQDYQDFGNGQRAAAPRIRQGAAAQEPARQPPVAILKQINKHNEDGSYTYGYEGADGSFKIETKLATGEVKGKYGYVDETGKVRVVEYGANKYGFQPSGEGITVAPPTLVDETTQEGTQYEDDQPRPQKPFIARVPRPQPQHQPQQQPRPQTRPVQARPQYVDYDEESEPEQPRQQQYSPGPAPPRLQIPGAQPVDVVYSPNQRPARPDGEYTQRQSFGAGPSNVRISRPVFAAPQAGPTSRAQQFAPQQIRPVTEAIPQYQPRPSPQPIQYHAPQAPQGRSTSVLDQLAKDYALPQGGSQPLHDISFGYF